MATLFDLTGRIALVTGGSRGLGLQIGEALGEYGATVVLAARKEKELDQAVTHLTLRGVSADAVMADLSSEKGAATLVETVAARHAGIHILVNAAGSTWGAPAEEYPLDGWNKVIDLSLTGLFLVTREVARYCMLPQNSGAVINVASTEGLLGHHPERGGTVAYNAAKGAVINMTRALAAEWGPRGIRVNALAPGFFPSKMTAQTIEQHGSAMIAATPLGKLGGECDLKGAALLLASSAGGHITGQTIVVDGGATII